jgi:glycosyltransferase involved in cell wall biosynthesis
MTSTHNGRTLSVIVITRNEAHNLHDCLQSVQGLANEVVVIDSNSTDTTCDIALQFGAVVSQPADWPGFGPQKQRALDLATCDWVLSLDADERVTPELAQEIRQVLMNDAQATTAAKVSEAASSTQAQAAYQMPRLSWYCGKFIRHSGWQPDHVLRLFPRTQARFSDDLVHERVISDLPLKTLRNHLLHYSYLNFSQVLSKTDAYSTASAQQAFAKGKRATVAGALGHGAWAFFRTYVIRAGFLDGAHGLALAISNAEASYYKYLKLWWMGQEFKKTKRNQ